MPETLTLEQARRDVESAIQFLEMTIEDEPDAHVPLRPDSLNQDIEQWSPEQWEIMKAAIQLETGIDMGTVELILPGYRSEWEFSGNISLFSRYDESDAVEYFFGKAGFWT